MTKREKELVEMMLSTVEAAALSEREECAKIADSYADQPWNDAKSIAAKIRQRPRPWSKEWSDPRRQHGR